MKPRLSYNVENQRVVIWVGDVQALIASRERATRICRPVIFINNAGLEFPHKGVNDVLDYLISLRDPFELLPEANPGLSMSRPELIDYPFSDTDPRRGAVPHQAPAIWKNSDWVTYFAAVRPRITVSYDRIPELANQVCIPADMKGGVKDVTVWNNPTSFSRPLVEYTVLEQFCDSMIGPSLSLNRKPDELSDRLLAAQNEAEAESLLEGIYSQAVSTPSGAGLTKAGVNLLWCGLNLLIPDFDARMARVKTYQKNWFPGELLMARKSYEDARAWLGCLKDE